MADGWRAIALTLLFSLVLALAFLLAGFPRLALGVGLGGIWGALYLFQLARWVKRFPQGKFGSLKRLLFVAAGFILFLTIGTVVFIGSFIGFMLFKPALLLSLAYKKDEDRSQNGT